MNTTKIYTTIPEETTNYINLLNYNVESRKNLIFEAAERFGKHHPITKSYEDEYFIYDMKYTLVRNNLTNAVIPAELLPYVNWNLDYSTSVMTISININDTSSVLLEKYKDSFSNKTIDIIDNDINSSLTSLYSQKFDDELGLVNPKCSCDNCDK